MTVRLKVGCGGLKRLILLGSSRDMLDSILEHFGSSGGGSPSFGQDS
jgi:hypothetical protein